MAENYDKSLLTLSSAFLGGSLAFTNQVVDLIDASEKGLLYGAWGFFGLTIGLTLYSFYYGLKSLQPLRDAAGRYYLNGEEQTRNDSAKVHNRTLSLSRWQGFLFAAGILLLGAFITLNIWEGNVPQKPKSGERGALKKPDAEVKAILPSIFQKPAAPIKPQHGTSGVAGQEQQTEQPQTQQPQTEPSAPAKKPE